MRGDISYTGWRLCWPRKSLLFNQNTDFFSIFISEPLHRPQRLRGQPELLCHT